MHAWEKRPQVHCSMTKSHPGLGEGTPGQGSHEDCSERSSTPARTPVQKRSSAERRQHISAAGYFSE
jgi:hypothetical protein